MFIYTYITKLDFYGKSPKLFIEGKSTYKTKLGTFFSILTLTIFFTHLYFETLEIYTTSNPNIFSSKQNINLLLFSMLRKLIKTH